MEAIKTLRVMIVDDNRIIRDGLTIFFKIFDDLKFVGSASNGIEAINLCEEIRPDVVLMDVMMPRMNGIEATRVIREKYPHIKVVGLTSLSGDETQAKGMMNAGAVACLPKQASIDEIVTTIRGY